MKLSMGSWSRQRVVIVHDADFANPCWTLLHVWVLAAWDVSVKWTLWSTAQLCMWNAKASLQAVSTCNWCCRHAESWWSATVWVQNVGYARSASSLSAILKAHCWRGEHYQMCSFEWCAAHLMAHSWWNTANGVGNHSTADVACNTALHACPLEQLPSEVWTVILVFK